MIKGRALPWTGKTVGTSRGTCRIEMGKQEEPPLPRLSTELSSRKARRQVLAPERPEGGCGLGCRGEASIGNLCAPPTGSEAPLPPGEEGLPRQLHAAGVLRGPWRLERRTQQRGGTLLPLPR